jgi:PRMT5 arginine-N-methyltransferase
MIPRRDRVWVAVTEIPETYSKFVGPWESNSLDEDLSPARRLAVNRTRRAQASADQLLTKPQLWATLDYATIEDANFQGDLRWSVVRGGTGHGLLAWFDADLAEGVGFSNAPGAPKAVYGALFFCWAQPVALVPQQTVRASLEAKFVGEEYLWRWTTEIEPAHGPGSPPIRFEQSRLHGKLLSVAALRRQAASYLPQLSDEGRIYRRTLEMMDGRVSLEEIARRLATEFPGRFAGLQEALSYAGGISLKYSE